MSKLSEEEEEDKEAEALASGGVRCVPSFRRGKSSSIEVNVPPSPPSASWISAPCLSFPETRKTSNSDSSSMKRRENTTYCGANRGGRKGEGDLEEVVAGFFFGEKERFLRGKNGSNHTLLSLFERERARSAHKRERRASRR